MNDVITSIIVEDEPIHSNRLKKLLTATDSRIRVLSVCHTIEEAFTAINTHQPDVIFLDIKLHDNPRGGFDLLKKFKKISFDVIFTTAHIDHNIKDIRRCGIDYLPKPYMPDELEEVLDKFWQKRPGDDSSRQINVLLSNLTTDQVDEQTISFRRSEGTYFVKAKNLIYCKSINQYTEIFIREDENDTHLKGIITTIGIGIWEDYLTSLNFCRIHDSTIINLKYITTFSPTKSEVTLKYLPEPLHASRNGKNKLIAEISKKTVRINSI
ncbi:LytR/AlgR family response regulator transcription factor [Chitinophaga sp. RAB17]|uniref:LytR/AlgR family response regulator transcription factor n=1 Tax=Chitinophaga sp. RAB17 TaxID=3233049 RepID=UPI003F8D9749